MWKTIIDMVKSVFGFGSGMHREKRLDFVEVGEQWKRIIERLEARLIIVEDDLETSRSKLIMCEQQHILSIRRIGELELELARHGYNINEELIKQLPQTVEVLETWRLLVVDDESIIRKSLIVLLKSEAKKMNMALDIEEASDGEEAIEVLRLRTFDAVFVDLKMPKVDGFELLTKTKHRMAFVMTGYFYPKLTELQESGMVQGVLNKPLEKKAIELVLRHVKQKRLG